MLSSFIAVAAIASVASAAVVPPTVAEMKRSIIKRQSYTVGAPDAVVLNFALTLEHLEDVFYREALAKFTAADFASAGFSGAYPLLQQVAADEANHVSFLTAALTAAGATPVQACNYTFPYTTVAQFLALSATLEGVGTSAYLGAAGSIATPAYLNAAGAILTVEARHNAFVRFLIGYSPAPSPYDTSLSASAVVTLATPFFVSCPAGSAPAIPGHPALTLATAAPAIGSNIMVKPTNASLAATFPGTVYCGYSSGLSQAFSLWTNGTCMIPTANVTNGQNYVFLTTNASTADASVLAGPAIVMLGPKNITVNLAAAASGSSPAGAATSGASLVSVSIFGSVFAGLAALLM